MRDDPQVEPGFATPSRRSLGRSEARLILIAALVTVLMSVAVCVAGVLVPAPAAAVPLIVAICVGCPMFATWEVPAALAVLRADRVRTEELTKLRQSLGQLPEIEHPLGF